MTFHPAEASWFRSRSTRIEPTSLVRHTHQHFSDGPLLKCQTKLSGGPKRFVGELCFHCLCKLCWIGERCRAVKGDYMNSGVALATKSPLGSISCIGNTRRSGSPARQDKETKAGTRPGKKAGKKSQQRQTVAEAATPPKNATTLQRMRSEQIMLSAASNVLRGDHFLISDPLGRWSTAQARLWKGSLGPGFFNFFASLANFCKPPSWCLGCETVPLYWHTYWWPAWPYGTRGNHLLLHHPLWDATRG